MNRLLFMDVSSYEANATYPIDFNKARANGVSAVSFRAAQGTAVDAYFKQGWADCKGVLPRQAYLLLDCRFDWKPQVQLLLDLTKDDPGELPLCIDFEPPFAMPDTQYWKYPFAGWNPLYAALEMIKTARPNAPKPWIYTNQYSWNLAGPKPGTPQDAYFSQYPLWVANYVTSLPLPDNAQPNLPHAWKNWLVWQFTESGQAGDAQKFGISPYAAHSVDESVFNGTLEDFQKLTGVMITPVPPPAPVTSQVLTDLSILLDSKQNLVSASAKYSDGSASDVTSITHVLFEPETVPTPVPSTPAPIKFGQPGIYSLKIIGQETPNPDWGVGTFAEIGGRGQTNWIELGRKEIAFIQSFLHNKQLWDWAATAKGTLYIARDDGNQTVHWPMILMSSMPGKPRQICRVTEFSSDGKWAHIAAIPQSSDYSQYTPDTHPEFFFLAYTWYPDNHIGEDSHNGMTFLMPIFDPNSGFKAANGNFGMWMSTDILYEALHE